MPGKIFILVRWSAFRFSWNENGVIIHDDHLEQSKISLGVNEINQIENWRPYAQENANDQIAFG